MTFSLSVEVSRDSERPSASAKNTMWQLYPRSILSVLTPLRRRAASTPLLRNNPDGRDDTWEKHTFDTIKGSDYLADQHAVEIMCKEAPQVVYEMEHWGCPFSRFPDGINRPATIWRGRLSADLFFRRYHRPLAPQHPLRTGSIKK